ncbi:MAG: NADPH-dependent 7-cyano-7-deazaguanine reductase QueF [Dehalococcoidia bacterium]|nr:NADPH-dependent 7-cyano-7-deazaguanine reductase QueF [Dehalococcoidia bacterium]
MERFLDLPVLGVEAIHSDCLLAFTFEHPGSATEIVISTDEFTAVCPWTGLPDQGTLIVKYLPGRSLLELKSFKYYLLSYRSVGIVQEHAANRILDDAARVCAPQRMEVTLDYLPRGGLRTVVTARYPNALGLGAQL